jgi:cytochrome b involved in lipid metabolism
MKQCGLTKRKFSFLGKDATEAFEDIGHSDEAREILEKYYVADLDEAVS